MILPKISKENRKRFIVGLSSYVLYGYALYPGRLYFDSAQLLKWMADNRSSDQWGASYFRILQVLTFNGQNLFIFSFLNAGLLYFMFYRLINSLKIENNIKTIMYSLVSLSPLLGVFAWTVGHDSMVVTVVLIYLRILYLSSEKIKFSKKELTEICFASLLSSAAGLGVLATLGFSISLFVYKKRIFSLFVFFLAFILFTFGGSILNVSHSKNDLSLMNFLGDVKCITQHPAASISEDQWRNLREFATESEWKDPKSCTVADNAFFALKAVGNHKFNFIKLWKSLVIQNPQIALQARFQRSSVALPPIFFRNPPNMFDENYSNPVGLNAQTDLQINPDLLKTSVDYEQWDRRELPAQRILESFVLFFTFILNQRSDFWGWGGMWLTLFWLVLFFKERKAKKVTLLLLPSMLIHIGVIIFGPSPSPRYVFSSILLGVTATAALITYFIMKLTSKESNN